MVYVSDLSSEWLESFEAHKIWFERVADGSRKGKLSNSMRLTYNSNMRQLVRFFRAGGETESNPDSILEWGRSSEPGEIMKALKNFSSWLQGKDLQGYERRPVPPRGKYLNERSADMLAHGSIRGFFTHNQIWLPRMGKRNGGRAPTKKNDVHFSIFKIDPNNPSLIIKDYNQYRLFLGNLSSFRDQTVALSLLSTSQDSGDLLSLNLEFVRMQDGRDRLYWEGIRAKTGEEFRTFFSKEATNHVRQYIAQERAGAGDDESIFMRRAGEDLSPKNVTDSFHNAAAKMGVLNGHTQNPYRPKRMRSIFSSACYQAKTDDGARHIFMGHSGSVSEGYREMPRANLEQIYARVEPFLTVFDDDKSQELAATRQKSDQALDLALDLREENKRMTQEIKDLREMVEGLNALVTALDEQMNEFRDSYQTE